MRAVIVTSSTSYEPRAEKVGHFLEACGYQVLWLESDFNHREKRKEQRQLTGHQYVDTVPYRKNLSVRRLYSQYDFARKVFRILKDQTADLLYVLIPANSLTPVAARIKKRCHARLVVDIIDLWPESLPVKVLERFWPVQYWRKLRDDYLGAADLVLTECKFYQELLELDRRPEIRRTGVMYWPKEKEAGDGPAWEPDKGWQTGDGFRTDREALQDSSRLHIAYLGSINHIIDMELIVDILRFVDQKKKVRLHVIGDGESREVFLEKLEAQGIETEYYGILYEEEKKQKIFQQCSFGINVMKESVRVGLTMKSVDYFCYGLPLINNIQGDTWKLIRQYDIGVNCGREDPEGCAEKIVEVSETIQEKRGLIRKLYEELFTQEAMENVLRQEVLPLLAEKEADR